MQVEAFYDPSTSTLTYVVFDPDTHDAVVIDPVLDYDPISSATSYESVNRVTRFVRDRALNVHYILETHAHADHLSGSQILRKRFPAARIGIGKRITEVQEMFKGIFDLPGDFATDGRQFDDLFDDGEIIQAGKLAIRVILTPGHTPACVTYHIGDAIFTGDVLFMPDMGTGRCDFPAGSATDLYQSITEKLYTLPDETRVFVGHDYQPGGRDVAYETTIAAEKDKNIQLPGDRDRDSFVEFRRNRDQDLAAPRLLLQSVQVNVDAGTVPRFLRIPINVFRPESAEEIQLDAIP